MRKCRDMERQMAPSSQTFSQGGILNRDWFSDTLGKGGQGHTSEGRSVPKGRQDN